MKYKVKIKSLDKTEINLSEDEIIEIKYNIGTPEKKEYANSRSTVEMEIVGKIISNLEKSDKKSNEKVVNSDLYEKNKQNVVNLVKWSESYLGDNDYRNVEVEVDLGGKKVIQYDFSNMFVFNFFQEFSIEKGIGIFKVSLKQKFHQEKTVNIK